jgi:hypothetical protein
LTRLQVSKHPRVSQKRFCNNGAPLPSTGSTRAVFPGVISTIRALRHPVTTAVLLIYSLHRPHFLSPPFAPMRQRRSAWARSRSEPRHHRLCEKWVASQGIPGSGRIHPIPLPRSKIPAGPADLTLSACPVPSPQSRPRRHQRCLFRNSTTRLRYPPSTLQVVRCRTRMQDWLPAGG